MHIRLEPINHGTPLVLERHGDTLTLNGAKLDLSGIPEGATLPRAAVDCWWLASGIERIDGVLHLALLLPHGPDAPEETRFPAPLVLTTDDPVPLPSYDITPEMTE